MAKPRKLGATGIIGPRDRLHLYDVKCPRYDSGLNSSTSGQ